MVPYFMDPTDDGVLKLLRGLRKQLDGGRPPGVALHEGHAVGVGQGLREEGGPHTICAAQGELCIYV